MFERSHEGGVAVTEYGVQGDEFYVVERGEYTATIPARGDEVVKRYTSGDWFGELALIYNVPRAATVTCVGAGSVFVLNREKLDSAVATSAMGRSACNACNVCNACNACNVGDGQERAHAPARRAYGTAVAGAHLFAPSRIFAHIRAPSRTFAHGVSPRPRREQVPRQRPARGVEQEVGREPVELHRRGAQQGGR